MEKFLMRVGEWDSFQDFLNETYTAFDIFDMDSEDKEAILEDYALKVLLWEKDGEVYNLIEALSMLYFRRHSKTSYFDWLKKNYTTEEIYQFSEEDKEIIYKDFILDCIDDDYYLELNNEFTLVRS